MPIVNFDAAGMCADIIPDRKWEYCGWCFKPRIDEFSIDEYKHAENVLKTLCCMRKDHLERPPRTSYVEAALLSYVFPYSDEIINVKEISPADYIKVLTSYDLTWDEMRDRINSVPEFLVWTYKSVGHFVDDELKIIPRHPTLGLSFL